MRDFPAPRSRPPFCHFYCLSASTRPVTFQGGELYGISTRELRDEKSRYTPPLSATFQRCLAGRRMQEYERGISLIMSWRDCTDDEAGVLLWREDPPGGV
jgi:hypothetical protein